MYLTSSFSHLRFQRTFIPKRDSITDLWQSGMSSWLVLRSFQMTPDRKFLKGISKSFQMLSTWKREANVLLLKFFSVLLLFYPSLSTCSRFFLYKSSSWIPGNLCFSSCGWGKDRCFPSCVAFSPVMKTCLGSAGSAFSWKAIYSDRPFDQTPPRSLSSWSCPPTAQPFPSLWQLLYTTATNSPIAVGCRLTNTLVKIGHSTIVKKKTYFNVSISVLPTFANHIAVWDLFFLNLDNPLDQNHFATKNIYEIQDWLSLVFL